MLPNLKDNLKIEVQMQKDLNLSFINYAKAFEKIGHMVLFVLLGKINLFGKYVRMTRNLNC